MPPETTESEHSLKPHPFQKAALAGMLALVLISFTLANLQSMLWINHDWLVSTILPAVVADETNRARAAEALPPLARSERLDRAAQMKADHMAAQGYFAHWSPDGVSPWYWFGEAGYRYVHAGENLAVHFTDSSAVVDAWLGSPSHRANILNGNYREIGIGTAKGRYEGFDTVFVVQMFGAPAAAAGAPNDGHPTPSIEEEGEVSVEVTEVGTVVYESFAAAEAPGAVLAEADTVYSPRPASFFGRLATSPRLALQIAYTIIGLAALCLLLAAFIIEWRLHHPVQMAYSAGLLAVITLLFVAHSVISGGVMIA